MATKSTTKKTTTARKTTAKKPATTRKSTAAKSTASKSSVSRTVKRKPTTRRSSSKKAKSDEFKSFHLAHSSSPFLTIAITKQTVYWLIIAAAVLALGLWTIHLQNEVNKIYDQFEAASSLVI